MPPNCDEEQRSFGISSDRVEPFVGGDEQGAVGGDGSRVNGAVEVDFVDELLFFAGREDGQVALLVAQVHLAVGDEGRAPDSRFGIVGPIDFAGVGVEAMQFSVEVGGEKKIVGDGNGGDGAANLCVGPEHASGAISAGFCGVDADEAASAFALLGVLADGDVDAIFEDDGRGDDLAGAGGCAVFLFALLGGIHVAAPDFLQIFIEAVAEAVAGAEDDLVLAVDRGLGGGGPVAQKRSLGDAGIFLGEKFASFFVEADQGGSVGGGGVYGGPVLAIGCGDVELVADDED